MLTTAWRRVTAASRPHPWAAALASPESCRYRFRICTEFHTLSAHLVELVKSCCERQLSTSHGWAVDGDSLHQGMCAVYVQYIARKLCKLPAEVTSIPRLRRAAPHCHQYLSRTICAQVLRSLPGSRKTAAVTTSSSNGARKVHDLAKLWLLEVVIVLKFQ